MKTATLIARILLGLIFVVFGTNGLLLAFTGKGFIPMPPPHEGLANDFTGALFKSGFMKVVFALQVLGGLIVLIGRCLNLGVFLLGPVVTVIFLFHLFMDPAGLPVAIVVFGLTLFLAWTRRREWLGVLCAS